MNGPSRSFRERELPLTARAAKPEPRAEREQDGRHVRRRVGVDDAASDRPEVPDLQVADPAGALGDGGESRAIEDLRRR